MKKVNISKEIHKAYSQILFEENVELNAANQMLKILEYGCVVLHSSDLNIEILRRIKDNLKEYDTVDDAVFQINVFDNNVKTDNDYNTKYFYINYCKPLPVENQSFITLQIEHVETITKSDEELQLEKISSRVLKYDQKSLMGKFKFSGIFVKYFRNINKDFAEKITVGEYLLIEHLAKDFLQTQMVTRDYDYKEARIYKILYDLKNKKELETWEMVMLNELLYRYRYKDQKVYKDLVV